MTVINLLSCSNLNSKVSFSHKQKRDKMIFKHQSQRSFAQFCVKQEILANAHETRKACSSSGSVY